MRYLLLFTLWVLCLTLHGAAPAQTKQEDGSPPKPAIAVSFARQTIREDDSVQAQIWLANEWEHDLTQVKLHVAIPAFLRWYAGTCKEWQEKNFQGQATQPFSFGPVQARRVYAQILCFRSSADIVVGDFNLLFTFEYEWPQQNSLQQSFVVVEKTLKVSLLGSDSVAGIPVGLAGFIVPGLIFWWIVARFNVPWLQWPADQLALGDRLIYSVVVSFVIVGLGKLSTFIDISAGIGLTKLGYLALVGLVCGGLIGVVDSLRRYVIQQKRQRQQQQAEAKLIKAGDSQDALLEKLVDSFPDIRLPQATVLLENGQQFKGSLARKDAGAAAALLGWFQISQSGQPPEIVNRLQALVTARQWREVLALARSQHLTIAIREPISEMTANGDEPQPEAYYIWESTDVQSTHVTPGMGALELITLQ